MDAVKRAAFHKQTLELHCSPDIDQALLEQLASVFGKIIRVTREPKMTCRGHIIIRIELDRHADLLDFNHYIQNYIHEIYLKMPPELSPQDIKRRDFETNEQSRRIKVNGLHSSRDYAYEHFKNYGHIEYCVRNKKNSYITICFFKATSKQAAQNSEVGNLWDVDSTIRNKNNERYGRWGPYYRCQKRVNLREELLESHKAICNAEATLNPNTHLNIFANLHQPHTEQDLEDISDSESCFAESTISEFCAVPQEYRSKEGNMGPFSRHFQ